MYVLINDLFIFPISDDWYQKKGLDILRQVYQNSESRTMLSFSDWFSDLVYTILGQEILKNNTKDFIKEQIQKFLQDPSRTWIVVMKVFPWQLEVNSKNEELIRSVISAKLSAKKARKIETNKDTFSELKKNVNTLLRI